MTEQYIRYAAMFIIIMMAVIDDYRRFKVSNRIIIAGMVIGVVINMGSLMYGGDVRGYIYGGMAGFAIMYMVYIFGGVGAGDVKLIIHYMGQDTTARVIVQNLKEIFRKSVKTVSVTAGCAKSVRNKTGGSRC